MTEEEIEKVANAIASSITGWPVVFAGDIYVKAAQAAITVVDQHRAGKGRKPEEEESSGPLGMRFTPLG